MRRVDFGEIIRGYVYSGKVYSTKLEKGKTLVSDSVLFDNLSELYSALGIIPLDNDMLEVGVRLPSNKNPKYRESWQDTVLKKMNITVMSLSMDSLAPSLETGAILATKLWMREFGVVEGENVVVKPLIPSIGEYSFG